MVLPKVANDLFASNVEQVRKLLEIGVIMNPDLANTNGKKMGKNAKKKMLYKSQSAGEQKNKSDDSSKAGNCSKQYDNVTNKLSEMSMSNSKGKRQSSSRHKSKAKEQNSPRRSPKKSGSSECEESFPMYWTKDQVDKGIKEGHLITGVFRINKNNYRTAYVTHPKGGVDIIVEGMLARNRALEGDVVVINLTRNDSGVRTGDVVYIKSQEHPRTCIGSIQHFNKNHKYLLFIPRDSRFPRMRIYRTDWPDALHNAQEQEVTKILYYAKLNSWNNTKYGLGSITKAVGKCGDIEVETKAILLENDLDVTPHGPDMDKYYPRYPFKIPKEEIQKRLDYRNKCVFTIDPLTAKDLDDAMSCEELPNGNLKIGVHISDVGYFLKPNNDLDKAVAFKATSIYMVESVYHMLPKNLCSICSLLPGQDRLAFSVFWEMNKDGEVLNSFFKKTVINSCTQLAYEHAQDMLDKDDLDPKDYPDILNNYNIGYVSNIVKTLQDIAMKLRKRRFDQGALKIDQPKLSFVLNPQSCLPEDFTIYPIRESNKLIEEFMLLANITVAKHLYDNLPQSAFLRAHPEPQARMLKDLQDFFKSMDMDLNIESSRSIQQSLWNIEQKLEPDALQGVMLVVHSLCSKTMTRAHYFCASRVREEEELRHYALSVDRYTHFTSPIRRYADIVVHRQLAHVLCIEEYNHESNALEEVAGQCNKNKYNAKKAGEMSCELFLSYYIVKNSPLVEDAIILDVKDRSIDVIIVRMNLTKRIYYESLISAKYDLIFNSSKKKVLAVNVRWDKAVSPEMLVTEYYQKSKLKSIQNSKSPEKRKQPLDASCLTNTTKLVLFSKIKVVVCGTNNNLLNVDAFLLP